MAVVNRRRQIAYFSPQSTNNPDFLFLSEGVPGKLRKIGLMKRKRAAKAKRADDLREGAKVRRASGLP